jgi:PmbA protein
MAKFAPEDPFCGLADSEQITKNFPELNLKDTFIPSVDLMVEKAKQTETAGLTQQGITNTEGASTHFGTYAVTLVASNGFAGHYERTVSSLSCSLVAGNGTNMERDYDYSVACFFNDLKNPESIGIEAAKKAIKRLNPRKISSATLPIIFDKEIASSLLSHLENAICGTDIARKTSFLKDKLGTKIFSDAVTIIDNPHILKGIGSSPFDGEGLDNKILTPIEKGILNCYLLDLATSKQLNLPNTARSRRSTKSPSIPSATNFYMEAGNQSVNDMIQSIGKGLLVTELIGYGVNEVTGDYSRGASGFWVENGEICYPVSEITIAGNLKDMFLNLIPANDLEFKGRTNSPSVLIDKMTIAGA